MYAFPKLNTTMLLCAFFWTAFVLLWITRSPQRRVKAEFFRPYNALSPEKQQCYDFKKLQSGENVLMLALYFVWLADMLLGSGIFSVEKGSAAYDCVDNAVFAAQAVVYALILISLTTEFPLVLFLKPAQKISRGKERRRRDILVALLIVMIQILICSALIR